MQKAATIHPGRLLPSTGSILSNHPNKERTVRAKNISNMNTHTEFRVKVFFCEVPMVRIPLNAGQNAQAITYAVFQNRN